MRMVFAVIKNNTAGKRARRRAVRYIGAQLIARYRDNTIREAQMARNKTHRDAKRKAKWRVKRVLWQIYLDPVTHMLLATEERPKESPRAGKIEKWAIEGRAGGLHTRVQHAVRCLQRPTEVHTTSHTPKREGVPRGSDEEENNQGGQTKTNQKSI